MPLPDLRTRRLLLRDWRPQDVAAMAAINADPRVREFFMRPLAAEETAEWLEKKKLERTSHGLGWWAVEIPGVAPLAGTIGLSVVTFPAPFVPSVEIGWSIAFEHWGHGYATEGAEAVLRYGFEQAGLDEIVAFTAAANRRSRRVMEKLGMTCDPADDFDHPSIAEGHPLRRHVLYRTAKMHKNG